MANLKKVLIFTDGGSRGNPGISGAGIVIDDGSATGPKRFSVPLGKMTNNEAEYHAAIHGLEAVRRLWGGKRTRELDIELRIDSELVAKQLLGKYQVKEAHLQPLFVKWWNLKVAHFPHLTVRHIPREENRDADRLANQAMDSV